MRCDVGAGVDAGDEVDDVDVVVGSAVVAAASGDCAAKAKHCLRYSFSGVRFGMARECIECCVFGSVVVFKFASTGDDA